MSAYVHNKCSVPECQSRPKGWPAQIESFCEEHKRISTVLCRDGIVRSSAEADSGAGASSEEGDE